MTLESQYKLYLQEHPESTFTFEEWKKWFSEELEKGINNFMIQQELEKKYSTRLFQEPDWDPSMLGEMEEVFLFKEGVMTKEEHKELLKKKGIIAPSIICRNVMFIDVP